MRPTIKDIAERAGVSKTTVSFALNDPGRISAETRKRVMDIVAELGYVPDPVARALTTKRHGALGLLLPQPIHEALANPYLCEIVRGIGELCEERGLALTMLPPVKGAVIEAARRAAVDALLTIGVGPGTAVAELLHRRHLPFVTIDGDESATTVNVGIDDEAAAYALMRHILGLGHRRVAVLSLMPESYLDSAGDYSRVSCLRLAGFERALAELGLGLASPGIGVVAVEGSLEGGRQASLRLLSDGGRAPTAIVAMSDAAALGAYEACRELGLAIPRDLSVAGFDDIPNASLVYPPLTTVHQPGLEKGAAAATLALALLAGEAVGHRILSAELVVRGSTAAPRVGAPAPRS
ncbi:MAG: LacI family DNA-binding transcriptional regulator [Spirochaetaceae bacterium]|nr:LacI family DNA-binding transcriptional regulator [Spirochaetaceae bacterium]